MAEYYRMYLLLIFSLYLLLIFSPGFTGMDLLTSSRLFNGAGAGGEPSDAQERLPLFQDIILFRRQQSLTAYSLI